MSKFKWKNIKKVGLGIVAFEGTEHLANIITELQDCLDYVSIGLQRKSYHGDPIELIDLNEIIRLRDEDHLVDNIVEIELNMEDEPRVQETDKRNILIQDAEDHGCTHVIIIDSDEFYSRNSFIKALKEIDDNDYEMTYCQYVNYYHDYKHFLVYPFKDGMYVPFVSKTKYRHSFECQDFPLPSDPTRRYVRPYSDIIKVKHGDKVYDKKIYTVDYHIFPWNTVKMHHLSWIRADIRKKVNMWSSKTCFDNYNDLIDKAVDVYNHFDENSTEVQKASLLFNTPNHEVMVKAFPKQYIFPKFDINTRLRPVKSYKKILVLNLSTTNSKNDLFNKLEQCGRETWAKDILDNKYDNIMYYKVIDTDKETYIDENEKTVYVKNNPDNSNLMQLIDRFLIACSELSKKYKFDYVLRTNTSTWCNIELINEFLATPNACESVIYTDRMFSCFWSTFNLYASGAALIMSKRNIDILDSIVKHTPSNILYMASDDVIISALMIQRAKKIKLNNYTSILYSFDRQNTYNETVNTSDLKLYTPFYQVKTVYKNNEVLSHDIDTVHTLREEYDINKMKTINDYWLSNKNTVIIDDLVEQLVDNSNKDIYVLPYSKAEYLKLQEDKNSPFDLYSSLNIMPNNSDTIEFLEIKAKECGYKH